jgi:hypothetical protein
MLTKRYMASVKNIPAIMKKIVEGTAPTKFTQAHLRSIGFKGSNDRGVIPLLKDLGFLTADGVPTPQYHEYRDRTKSTAVMADALRKAYEDVFHINEHPKEKDRKAIQEKFKSVHNVTDDLAKFQTRTFFALLKLADLDTVSKPQDTQEEEAGDEFSSGEDKNEPDASPMGISRPSLGGLRYNIEVHLPATKDVEVYNAIFKSLKEHLLED